jgi:hypothetical protein
MVSDSTFSGPNIHYNQATNRIWMNQPGEFSVPSSRLNSFNGGRSLQWDMPLQCLWQEGMQFDGQTVRLKGGIRITGAVRQQTEVWLMEGLCREMELQLSQAINLSRSAPGSNSAADSQLSQITLRDDVDLRVAQRDATGDRVSLERLLVPSLTIFVPQEKIVAYGPGRAISKFLNGRPLGSLASSRSKRLQQIQCGHLTFRDSLVAFLDRREIVADGSVCITSSPIDHWDQNFDPASLTRLKPGQMNLTSDQVKLYDTSTLNSTVPALPSSASATVSQLWEVQALGNVVFDGGTESGDYAGSANQVTYVQSKDQLSMRGDGRSKATLRRLPAATTAEKFPNPTTVQVDSAVLNVKSMGLEQSQGLYVHVDFQNTTDPGQSSDPSRSGVSNTQNPGPRGQTSTAPGLPSATAQPPNPRDAYDRFRRGFIAPSNP